MTQMTSAHRLVVVTLGLAVIAVMVAYSISGVASLLVAALLCVLLWFLRPLLLPPGYGAMRVRTLSIVGIFGLAASYGFWSQLIDAAVKALASRPEVRTVAPWIDKVDLGSGPSVAVLFFVVAGLWIVHHYMADTTIAGGHPVPMKIDFPEETFQKKLESFCSALRQHLVTTDREANWSPDYYADLEAEVEVGVMAGAADRKRVADLQAAIRSDRVTQAFLILGEPGGGKSVALRKLARDMIDEVGTAGRVPLYINLREWLPQERRANAVWTEQNKPTIQELEAFVLRNIKARGDVFTEEFADKYFRDLWKHGRLFFIFDSFDEIPELLDANEESWLINALSDVLSRFISSHPRSRGVLASRPFRRPTQAFLAQKVLDIRSLAEEKIVQALTRFPAFTAELRMSLFRDRIDLIPIARNPFLMALLGEWVTERHTLPGTQAELYESYLKGRLLKVSSRIAQYGLSEEDVLQGATDIACFVFESQTYGLEAPVRVIDESGATRAAVAVIDVLSYARIGRVTPGEPRSFAFVHRRFLEYLVTMRLLLHPDKVPVNHIPTDSRGRDVLVLYAQLCDAASARSLAGLCWSEILAYFDEASTRLRATHCLRFLIDAFRARREAVTPFASELAGFINRHVVIGDDLVHAKICLEATGLLAEIEAVPILKAAMAGNNSWLHETAFRACRHLPWLEPELQESVARYVIAMPVQQFWASRRALTFSLSLSESLKGVQRLAVVRYRNLIASAVALPTGFILSPLAAVVSLGYWIFIRVTVYGPGGGAGRARPRRVPFYAAVTALMLDPVQSLRTLAGVMLLAVACLASFSSVVRSVESEWSWDPGRPWIRTPLVAFLGMMTLDWLLLRAAWHGAARLWHRITVFAIVKAALLVLGFSAVMWGYTVGVVWVVKLLSKFGLEWLLIGITVVPLAAGFGTSLFRAIREVYRRACDRRALKGMTFADGISRRDIAATLGILLTNHSRLAFVHQLAQRRITVTGEWPEGFRLSVAGDLVHTELAKLEERWLKLDR